MKTFYVEASACIKAETEEEAILIFLNDTEEWEIGAECKEADKE